MSSDEAPTAVEAERWLWKLYRHDLISKYTWTRATREVRAQALLDNRKGNE
jgi:hypothetical protein